LRGLNRAGSGGSGSILDGVRNLNRASSGRRPTFVPRPTFRTSPVRNTWVRSHHGHRGTVHRSHGHRSFTRRR
jgi:hypothetical protein